MTQHEINFALKIEALLGQISSPEYRQINVEVIFSDFDSIVLTIFSLVAHGNLRNFRKKS